MKLIPASSARWMMRTPSSWSVLPQAPSMRSIDGSIMPATYLRPYRAGRRVAAARRMTSTDPTQRRSRRRTDQRRAAAFALYQAELTGRELDGLFERDASTFTRALAFAAQDYQPDLDALIARHARGWTVERIAPLEKAIMRIALLEMLHADAAPAEQPIPAEGAIDEAVETAKTFCGAQAPGFVNGILAAALRQIRDNPEPS